MSKNADNSFYNGTKLLSLKDLDGCAPELYLCCTNRTAGKTVFFNSLGVNKFQKHGQKLVCLCRFQHELNDYCDTFFQPIAFKYGNNYDSQKRKNGLYYELYLDGKNIGYVLALNSADKVKKVSGCFYDADLMLFDEFLSETDDYCANEIQKFQSVHASLARGGGSRSRYLPCIMYANLVNPINPYFNALNIVERLDDVSRYIRGSGWVLEIGNDENASCEQAQSAFNKAFSNTKYTKSLTGKTWSNIDERFIEPLGAENKRVICTLYHNGKHFGVYECDGGLLYVGKISCACGSLFAVDNDDHTVGTALLKYRSGLCELFKKYFYGGFVRFADVESKYTFIKAIS